MKTKLFFISLLVVLALSLSACAAIQPAGTSYGIPAPRTITVTGTTKVIVEPDVAYISVGVHSEGASVAEALESNNQSVASVIAAIKEMGVAEEDIQTSNFSVYTHENWDMEGNRQANSYVVDNTVYLTVREISMLSELLDTAISAGANFIYGISFDRLDKSELVSQGRIDAIADAEAQALELAAATGVTLGEVQSVQHYTGYSQPYYGGLGGGAAVAAEAVSISPGQLTMTVEVTMVFEIE